VKYLGYGYGRSGYVCPVPDSSRTRKVNITVTDLHLYASGGQWKAKACYAQWDGVSGACDEYSQTSGNGHKTLQLGDGNGYWDETWDFGFIYVYATNTDAGRFAGTLYANF
jgi:hypothetical protein